MQIPATIVQEQAVTRLAIGQEIVKQSVESQQQLANVIEEAAGNISADGSRGSLLDTTA